MDGRLTVFDDEDEAWEPEVVGRAGEREEVRRRRKWFDDFSPKLVAGRCSSRRKGKCADEDEGAGCDNVEGGAYAL